MEQRQAPRIPNAFANGVHPATGEAFAADSPYQHPDTVRALFEAVRCFGMRENESDERARGLPSPPRCSHSSGIHAIDRLSASS